VILNLNRTLGRLCRSRGTVVTLFCTYLLVGFWLCDDYGVSWDEQINHDFGNETLDYVGWKLGIAPDLGPGIEERMRSAVAEQGPLFELVLAGLEWALRLDDSREILLMRHYTTFMMFWCGALAFYFLLQRTLRDDVVALLGTALLITTPRLFAHSFYNSKDTVLLAMFVIATLTMVMFLERRTWRFALLHALACAITIDIRIVGLLLPALTLLFLALQALDTRFVDRVRDLRVSGLFIVMLATLLVVFWPQLWGAPVSGFVGMFAALGEARQLEIPLTLFFGNFIAVDALPWYYLPSWMAITIPPLIGLLFLVGLGVSLAALVRSPLNREHRSALLFILLLFLPLVAVMVLRPILYDGWRHFYFVYPALLTIAMLGAVKLCSYGRMRGVMLGTLVLATACSTYAVVRDHPYQQVYFNLFAGADIEGNFELDYWGLSFREGFETILNREPSGVIRVAVSDTPGFLNPLILAKDQRDRLRFVRVEDADYFLSNHRMPWDFGRFRNSQFPYENEVDSIKVGNARILGIYIPTPPAVLPETKRSIQALPGGPQQGCSSTQPAPSEDIAVSFPSREISRKCCVDCLSPRAFRQVRGEKRGKPPHWAISTG